MNSSIKLFLGGVLTLTVFVACGYIAYLGIIRGAPDILLLIFALLPILSLFGYLFYVSYVIQHANRRTEGGKQDEN